MSAVTETLFRSDDLLVRAVPGSERDTAFLTFAPYSDFGDLDRPGFGEHFFQSRGFDAVHVLSRRNHWYQHAEMDAAIAAIAAWTKRYRNVVAYGSSMGGFAALTYGAACGAHTGLALSPQYSVDPALAPFENRWLADVKAIRFRRKATYPRLRSQYIVYDPLDDFDDRHAALLAQTAPTTLIRARNGGHPVGAYLNETGLLEPLLEAISTESLFASEVPLIEAFLRERRHRSGQYLFTLARRVPDHRPTLKLALANAAVDMHQDSPAYLAFQAEMLHRNGRTREAEAIYLAALDRPDAGPHPGIALVTYYRETGREAEAEQRAAELVADYPSARPLQALLRAIRFDRLERSGRGRMAVRLGLATLWYDVVDRLRSARRQDAEPPISRRTVDGGRSSRTA